MLDGTKAATDDIDKKELNAQLASVVGKEVVGKEVLSSALKALGPDLAKQQPAWLEGVEISGRQLAVAGLPMPILNPETALLLHLQRR